MVCGSHLAEDVTQGVFVALAQNARQLTHHPVLSGWLHRTTQNLAANAVRTNVRRQTREQEAAAMNELLSTGSDASWEHIAPHLDAALGELSEPDRDAVLLRYFEKKSAQEMAERLGISDEAAQKRVSRAVERLREFFAKRGVTIGASGLVVVVSANAVQAAPAGLAVAISAAAVLAGTTIATTATAIAIKAITMTTLQKTFVAATVAVLAGAGIYEARQNSNLREQVRSLQQQQAPLAEQIEQLQTERDAATNRMAALRDETQRLNRNTSELLKLRAEISQVRRSATPVPNEIPEKLASIQQPAALATSTAPDSGHAAEHAAEVLTYPESLRKLATNNFARATNALANAKSDFDRYLVLSEAAKLALVLGNAEDARKYATEVLALDQRFIREPWRGGDAVFAGNLVLGRMALLDGQTEAAKQYLLESGKTVGSPPLMSFGPNMTLARDLLKIGEQDTVLQFFDLCGKFWGSSGQDKLTQWTQDVKSGKMPDFGSNIYY